MHQRSVYGILRVTLCVCLLVASASLLTTLAGWRLSIAPPLESAAAAGRTMSAEAKPHIVDWYAKRPLSFERNDGQTDARVKFISRGDGYTLFLAPAEAVLALAATW
jgi:hypothetical protein